MRLGSGGRGLFAREAIAAGDTIFEEHPFAVQLVAENKGVAVRCVIGEYCTHTLFSLGGHAILRLLLSFAGCDLR